MCDEREGGISRTHAAQPHFWRCTASADPSIRTNSSQGCSDGAPGSSARCFYCPWRVQQGSTHSFNVFVRSGGDGRTFSKFLLCRCLQASRHVAAAARPLSASAFLRGSVPATGFAAQHVVAAPILPGRRGVSCSASAAAPVEETFQYQAEVRGFPPMLAWGCYLSFRKQAVLMPVARPQHAATRVPLISTMHRVLVAPRTTRSRAPSLAHVLALPP